MIAESERRDDGAKNEMGGDKRMRDEPAKRKVKRYGRKDNEFEKIDSFVFFFSLEISTVARHEH